MPVDSSYSSSAAGRRRRGGAGLLAAAATLALVAPASVQAATPPAPNGYWYVPADLAKANNFPDRAFVGNMADPSVYVENGTYYQYSTSNNGNFVSYRTSTDAAVWRMSNRTYPNGVPASAPNGEPIRQDTAISDALIGVPTWMRSNTGGLRSTCGPAWTPKCSQIWGPSVAKLPKASFGGTTDKYVMVYTAAAGAPRTEVVNGQSVTSVPRGIGVAVADSPTGPFTDFSTKPLWMGKYGEGSLDPHVMVDSDGKAYVVWEDLHNPTPSQPDSDNRVMSAQLTLDITTTPGKPVGKLASTPKRILSSNDGSTDFERGVGSWVIENPALVKYNNTYYVFYSSGEFMKSNYRTGYAICDNGPLQPCRRPSASAKPLINPSATLNMSSPGAGSPFIDASGQLRMIYAAWAYNKLTDNGYTDPTYQRFGHVATLVQDPVTKELQVSRYNAPGAVHEGLAPTDCSNTAAILPRGGNWFDVEGCTFKAASPVGTFAVTPTRVADTRSVTYGRAVRKLPAGGRLVVAPMRGEVVPGNATAAFATITAIAPEGDGYLTVYPQGEARPLASVLNFTKGTNVPNLALVKLGRSGAFEIVNGGLSPVDVAVDINGYVAGTSSTVPGDVVPLSPQRVTDTRSSTPFRVDETRTYDLTRTNGGGSTGVPSSTGMVFGVLAAGQPSQRGWGTLFATGATPPATASVNFTPQYLWRANAFAATPDGAGRVNLVNKASVSPATTHYILDTMGYSVAGAPTAPGRVGSVAPTRLAANARIEAGGVLNVPVTSRAGVPASARAGFLTVSLSDPPASGYITAFPSGVTAPTASMLNMTAKVTTGNSTFVAIGSNGMVSLKNSSTQPILVNVDVTGYAL